VEEWLVRAFLGRQERDDKVVELLSLTASNNPAMAGHLLTYHTLLLMNYSGRMLFRTANGSMGLGTPGMVVGDSICHLVGHDFPFVLRKISGHYLVVGECFVLNLDPMEVMEDEFPSLEEFEIH
jgi:hypothetical protein